MSWEPYSAPTKPRPPGAAAPVRVGKVLRGGRHHVPFLGILLAPEVAAEARLVPGTSVRVQMDRRAGRLLVVQEADTPLVMSVPGGARSRASALYLPGDFPLMPQTLGLRSAGYEVTDAGLVIDLPWCGSDAEPPRAEEALPKPARIAAPKAENAAVPDAVQQDDPQAEASDSDLLLARLVDVTEILFGLDEGQLFGAAPNPTVDARRQKVRRAYAWAAWRAGVGIDALKRRHGMSPAAQQAMRAAVEELRGARPDYCQLTDRLVREAERLRGEDGEVPA